MSHTQVIGASFHNLESSVMLIVLFILECCFYGLWNPSRNLSIYDPHKFDMKLHLNKLFCDHEGLIIVVTLLMMWTASSLVQGVTWRTSKAYDSNSENFWRICQWMFGICQVNLIYIAERLLTCANWILLNLLYNWLLRSTGSIRLKWVEYKLNIHMIFM